ncbi:aminotransferase-like domain-containing protein [Labilibaculum euxinus]|uniref:Aminotransferase class I/II-fold pyridoxal phosphate-dependent enzyme n=1 Tax=Labilibaculum euxinus TaxID=2686357 RepID=A0A7M4DAL7_9BACT|nr:PLP-dependent aminotransferase family protein [Labilibaculum euxinus]MUP39696.1 aminotransferase class I/II-fold pyridoxal phosphate-dependent enzyme [Labilibaculum euxinus]MVB08901.1 aminotransferase class I/II-fold pyridoxal phosphate-dependent enzyme [Labilibaculum euxinus]
MITNLEDILSDSAKNMKRSVIRELLKLTQKPEIISFAGGLPAPNTFPIEELKQISNEVLEEDGDAALQYGATEGDTKLREILTERYQKQGLTISSDNLVILTSSQQGLDLAGKIFLNRGDHFICGLPSYLGGLGAFSSYGATPVGIKFDEFGMRSDLLEKTLAKMLEEGELPKFIYVIPDFQNPAGITMPEFRRLEIIAIAKKYNILIIEDSPYRELRFEGKDQKMMFELDNSGHVIALGTFSKIFVPGFRIGWVIAHEAIIDKFVKAKQSTDLCTSPFVQKIAAKYLEKGLFDKNLKTIIEMYHRKRDVMLDAFEEFMPKGVTWTKPEGGLFLFLNLPENMDAQDLFEIAIQKNVAFVLGSAFHCDGSGKNTMRINFSYVDEEHSRIGVQRLAESIKMLMNNKVNA